MRILTCTLVLAASLAASTNAAADPERKRFCSDSLVQGTYAIQLSGTRPAPGGQVESVIGVVVRLYDGQGNITQIDNVKGSVTGIIENRFGAGKYQVNDDCTVDLVFHPAPNLTLREKGVIMDEGKELRTIVVEPAGVMVTATHRRI